MDAESDRQNAGVEPLDRMASFFASDVMLANQFNDLRRSQKGDVPIRRLLLAVLEDGLQCFLGSKHQSGVAWTTTRRTRLENEASEWIFDLNAEGPFSFNGLCEGLDLDPAYMREKLARVAGQVRLPRKSPVQSEDRRIGFDESWRGRERRRAHREGRRGIG